MVVPLQPCGTGLSQRGAESVRFAGRHGTAKELSVVVIADVVRVVMDTGRLK